MKLNNCKSCGKEIAQNTRVCTHCGHKYSRVSGCFAFSIIFLIVSSTIGYVISNLSKKDSVEISPITKEANYDIPGYTILFVNEAIDGSGKFGDVLVPSLSLQTSSAEREFIARKIAKKEAINSLLFLYSTIDAYQANISASYAKAHASAFRKGFLGTLDKNGWIPGESACP